MVNTKDFSSILKKADYKAKDVLAEHVRKCDRCYVLENGEVLHCRTADSIIQAERKRKFFGE